MKKCGFCVILACQMLGAIQAFSQGIVRGKISDENGEFLIGASVFLKEESTIGVSTDLDGYYSLSIPDGKPYTLVVSYVSYETIENPVIVEKSQVLVLDLAIKSVSVNLSEVKVVARQERSNTYFMESIKKKSASTLDYISGATMSKIGDNNVATAIARVTGVSTNGSFITVRGLGDRYVQTCINGALIPTLDPFTNNIKLDLFPSSFVDNIIITKTASPDLQGDWAAAFISIETKDNPDKFALSIETKVGFNPQTSFKQIITNETSGTDWLGFDNGFRDIQHGNFVAVTPAPTPYEELCALGLEKYYRSIGITESWQVGSQVGEKYFRLGLVELGLLGSAFINDDQAADKAKELYYGGTYRNEAFEMINQKAEVSLNDFANNWSTFKKSAPLNISQSFSVSNQSTLFGNPFSFLAGFRYGNTVQYDAKSTFTRTLSSQLDTLGIPYADKRYVQQIAKYTNGWTGLLSGSYKLNPSNSFYLLIMPNVTGTNNIREGLDQLGSTNYRYAFLQGQFYEERSQFLYQCRSEHYISAAQARLSVSASYADGQSSAPDFKTLQYFSEDSVVFQLDKTISNVRRNFRYLDEDIVDLKTAIEFQLTESAGWISKLKFGCSFLERKRTFQQYDYLLDLASGVRPEFTNGNLNELFTDERFDIRTDQQSGQSRIDLYYRQFSDPSNLTIGNSKIYSGFAMIDQSVTERIRISTGLRVEYAEIFTDVKLFSELGYAPDDLRRRSPQQSFVLHPSNIEKWNVLPSANLIFKIKADELFPSQVRMNYSRAVARPSVREYTESVVRDFELNADVFGNADLKFVEIDNFDFRYENYFASNDFITVSLFYKKFKNHIELTSSNIGFTWSNAEKSNVYGIEVEGRKKLGSRLELSSNISVVRSNTQVEDRRLFVENGIKSWVVLGIIERNMFGQAPYVVNAILNYTSTKGFSASMSYNLQGPKLVLTSIDAAPDVYEMPRHLLNLKLSKPIHEYFDLSFTVKDIFNSPVRRSYKYTGGYLLDFDHYRYGTEYIVGISYSL